MVIGLDGMSPQLVEKWRDVLPNLRAMERSGVWGVLESVVPPSSVPAWQCFATGKNPAKIGVWGFISIGPDRTVRKGRTTPEIGCFWDRCSEAGLKVGVFNVPGTFPPYSVNGFMVSGFPTPPGKAWAFPKDLMGRLDKAVGGYEIDVPLTKPSEMRGGEEAYLAQVERLHRKSVEAAKSLVEWFGPDVFMMTLQGIDMVQHDFWRYMRDEGSPFASVVRDWYVKLDEAVGELRKLGDEETTVLVLSDHGSLPVSMSLHVNEFLRANGLLRLRNTGKVKQSGAFYTKMRAVILKSLPPDAIRAIYRVTPSRLAHKLTVSARLERTLEHLTENIDWANSLAFSTGGHQAAIYANLQPSGNGGNVDGPREVVSKICNLFSELRHPKTGEKLRPLFHLRERVFSGPFQSEAPDLCVELFSGGEKVHMNPILGSGKLWSFSPHLSAEHVREGFWAMTGPRVVSGVRLDASILDLAPTILELLGVRASTDFDGRVLDEVLAG